MAVSPAAISEAPRNSRVETPDWDNVPFAVGCARCGADLRGQIDPKCKLCGLEFDWADAVPIEQLTCKKCGYHLYGLRETRCPECGSEFTWDEALDRFHRQRLPYFEYRWRDRPIRSFIRTWWMSLRPRKFWRTMQLHDPPQVWALLAQVLISWLVFIAVDVLLNGIAGVVGTLAQRNWRHIPGQPWIWDSAWWLELFREIAWWWRYRVNLWGTVGPSIALISWWPSTLAALLIFQQSMRRIHVRSDQVVRVWAYAMTPTSLAITPIVYLAVYALIVVNRDYLWGYEVMYAGGIAVIICASYSLLFGYRYYLKMPHTLGIVIAVQTISLMFTLVVNSLFIALGGINFL